MTGFALVLRYWYFAVIAALVLLLGAQQMRVSNAKTALAQYKLDVSNAQRKAADLARRESERKQQLFDDEAAAARSEKQALEADVVRLADVADGLRGDLANFRKRVKQATQPANGGKGQRDPDPVDLLAILYQRADAEAGVLAESLDRVRSAGILCERLSDKAR